MRAVEKLQNVIQNNPHLAKMSGGILYSSVEALKEGKFYFLGVNPGGTGGALIDFDTESTLNDYIDAAWQKNKNAFYDEGKAPLQMRVQNLFKALGVDIRTVCASNLIFQQTQNIRQLSDIYSLADQCFPIHQCIIDEIVKPKYILSMGKTVYDYFVDKQGYEPTQAFLAGHGSWTIRIAKKDQRILINLPHLSYYDPFSYSESTKEAKCQAIARLKESLI